MSLLRTMSRDMVRLCFIACLASSLLAACERAEKPVPKPPPPRETIYLGLIPERQVFKQVERYRPLAKYLSRKCNVRVETKVLPEYGNVIDNFVSLGLDGAFFGSFTYVLGRQMLGLEPLARPEAPDGSSTYSGLIFARRERGIRTAADMKGRVFVFVDRATTAGYLFPLVYFRKHGIADYSRYFSETYFAGTHEDAVYDVLRGKADMGAAKNTVFARLAAADRSVANELVILAESPPVPENALAVRKDLDGAVKKCLKETLLAMNEDPDGKMVLESFGAWRFIETTERHYAHVYALAAEAGLDLASYRYRND